MIRVLVVLLVAVCVNAHAATFNWKHRNVNPYMGSISAAVEDYADIFGPAERKELARRIDARDYDDIVEIRRDTLTGRYRYDPRILRMHSGSPGTKDPLRTSWTAQDLERGLTYCSGTRCILVPTVCRNVSLIYRVEQLPVQPAQSARADGGEPLVFVPPAAGEGETGGADVTPTSSEAPNARTLSVLPGSSEGTGENSGGYPPGFGSYTPPFIGGGGIVVITVPPTPPVPEPATWALMLTGAVALLLHTRKRNV